MSASGSSIAFRGLVADGLGIALWQADGSGPEAAATGHKFVAPFQTITAHYYIASRDYVDAGARGGLAATDLAGAWRRTRAALATARCELAHLVLLLPLTTAGADREGEDWFYRDDVETRYLQPQAPLPLRYGDATLLEFSPPRLVLTEDYRGARQFADVRIALASDPTRPRRAAAARPEPAALLADALLADIGDRAVRFTVDTIRLTPLRFAGAGRTSGRYAEIPSARLEVVTEL